MVKRFTGVALCLILVLFIAGCAQAENKAETQSICTEQCEEHAADVSSTCMATEKAGEGAALEQTDSTETEEKILKLYFNDTEIPVTWENNAAVRELSEEAAGGDITVSMSMYGGWEQVGSLGRSYTGNDSQMTAMNGDIVLYSGNQIVVFYGSNSWAYTKLGKMNLSENEVTNLLSNGDITLILRY